LEKNISNVAISKSGKYVAATSMSDNHEISVFDVVKNTTIAYGQGPKSVIYAVKFSMNEEDVIVACEK
jgi:WD40 repeat protein